MNKQKVRILKVLLVFIVISSLLSGVVSGNGNYTAPNLGDILTYDFSWLGDFGNICEYKDNYDKGYCRFMRGMSSITDTTISAICSHTYDREMGDGGYTGRGRAGNPYNIHVEGENINYFWMNETNTSQTNEKTIYKISMEVESRGILKDPDDTFLDFHVWAYASEKGHGNGHVVNLYPEGEEPEGGNDYNFVSLEEEGDIYSRKGENMILIDEDILEEGFILEYICLEFDYTSELTTDFKSYVLTEGRDNTGNVPDSLCNKISWFDEGEYVPEEPSWLFEGDSSGSGSGSGNSGGSVTPGMD